MRREGSPWTGVAAVFWKELADHLASTRMRLLEVLVFLTGVAAVYSALGSIRDTVGQDPFIFLHVFTVAREPLPSFLAFLGFLIPIVAISLGFDSVNGEFNRRTMSRILAQPIYRDALLLGKFLAGVVTLACVLAALWLFVTGLGILMLGLPPSAEEVARGVAFLVACVAYGSVWLGLAITFSVVFRSPATAALAGLALWLFFAFFWQMIVSLIVPLFVSTEAYDPFAQLRAIDLAQALGRLSPNTLFAEISMVLLNPATRSLGPVFAGQLQGAVIGAPLPFEQSALLVWPQMTGLLAAIIALFTVAYVIFQRQEVRA